MSLRILIIHTLYYSYSPQPLTDLKSSVTPSYNRLSRFTVNEKTQKIEPSTEYILINQLDQSTWHNGGDMYFGPDGLLYFTNGDEGGESDSYDNAQRISRGLFSGVFRIDVNNDPLRSHAIRRQPQSKLPPPEGWPASFSQGYSIPNDNPWTDPNGTVLEEFYSIGLRSPHRMSRDPVTGATLIGEDGQNTFEEIDLLAAGANFQWPYMEGTKQGQKPPPETISSKEVSPIYAYNHSEGDGAIIGGHVYRGSTYAASLWGLYIFGDHVSGKIWAINWQDASPVPIQLTSAPTSASGHGLTGFGLDKNRELYLMTMGVQGHILKLVKSGIRPSVPPTLSATGAFTDLASLTPARGVLAYDVNTALWSDGAEKQRWIALPGASKIYVGPATTPFTKSAGWRFPPGTVLIKQFSLPVDARNPKVLKRLETRFLVRDSKGGVYGLTYKWRSDNSDADLLPTSLTENIDLIDSDASSHLQSWYYPSRENCQVCHNPGAGYILGVKAAQLNGSHTYLQTGVTDNQLRTWSKLGLFSRSPAKESISGLSKMANISDTTVSLEIRARSYLDVNCAHCHHPNGVRANWDARFDTPLADQNIINGLINDPLGIPGASLITPQEPQRSAAYLRLDSLTEIKMPPLARNTVDDAAVNLFEQWILSMNQPLGANSSIVRAASYHWLLAVKGRR